MTLFTYQAKNKAGETYENTIEAADKIALYKIIHEEGGTLVSVKEAKSASLLNLSLDSFFAGITTQEKINFAKNLGAMIDAGLSVTRTLSVMNKQAKRKPLKALLTDLEADVSRGTTLSESLAKR